MKTKKMFMVFPQEQVTKEESRILCYGDTEEEAIIDYANKTGRTVTLHKCTGTFDRSWQEAYEAIGHGLVATSLNIEGCFIFMRPVLVSSASDMSGYNSLPTCVRDYLAMDINKDKEISMTKYVCMMDINKGLLVNGWSPSEADKYWMILDDVPELIKWQTNIIHNSYKG